jgi:hypothetical protein
MTEMESRDQVSHEWFSSSEENVRVREALQLFTMELTDAKMTSYMKDNARQAKVSSMKRPRQG